MIIFFHVFVRHFIERRQIYISFGLVWFTMYLFWVFPFVWRSNGCNIVNRLNVRCAQDQINRVYGVSEWHTFRTNRINSFHSYNVNDVCLLSIKKKNRRQTHELCSYSLNWCACVRCWRCFFHGIFQFCKCTIYDVNKLACK